MDSKIGEILIYHDCSRRFLGSGKKGSDCINLSINVIAYCGSEIPQGLFPEVPAFRVVPLSAGGVWKKRFTAYWHA